MILELQCPLWDVGLGKKNYVTATRPLGPGLKPMPVLDKLGGPCTQFTSQSLNNPLSPCKHLLYSLRLGLRCLRLVHDAK